MDKPLSIYVHIPFCEKRCPYCDFVSGEVRDVDIYIEEVCSDVKKQSAKCKDYTVNTIYFGGGTPSLIDAEYIVKLLDVIRENYVVEKGAEITIECNPNSISREKFDIYRRSGINRISIGVQSFCNVCLGILGRVHDVKQAKSAIELACEMFDNVSIDLIHSIPNGRPKLPSKYIAMVQHISAYALTSDKYEPVPDEQSIAEQKRFEKTFKEYGLEKYEVSNFAKRGFESRHNLNYWRCGEWFGFGMGAKGHFGEPWDNQDRIMLGLRTAEGISRDLLKGKEAKIDELVNLGLLKCENGRVCCTQRGFLLLNRVILELI